SLPRRYARFGRGQVSRTDSLNKHSDSWEGSTMSRHKRYSGNGVVTRPTRGKNSADAKAETLRRRQVRAIKYASLTSELSAVTRRAHLTTTPAPWQRRLR